MRCSFGRGRSSRPRGITTAVPQIAADSLQRPSRQSRVISGLTRCTSIGHHRSRTTEAASRQQSVREGHSCPGRMRTRRSQSTTAGDLRLRVPCAWRASPAAPWRNPKDCDRAPNEESCIATSGNYYVKGEPGIEHRMPKTNPNRRQFGAYPLVEVALRRPVHPAFIGRPPGATMPHRCNSMKTAEFD